MNQSAKEQVQRFAAGAIAGTVAITLILPFGGMRHAPQYSSEVNLLSLVPAAFAWLFFMRDSSRLASFRIAMLTVALVGVGGLGLRSISQVTSPWIKETVESAQFVPQAIVYVGIALLGLIGSLLIASDEASGT